VECVEDGSNGVCGGVVASPFGESIFKESSGQ
jgi:hypothetical protein